MENLLFVYGTLRRRSRHPMARRLADAARHVGAAKIAGRLYDLGRFPGLKPPRTPEDWVQGDVYDLGDDAEQTLREMDAYENVDSAPPAPYDRQLTPVVRPDGQLVTVWVYWYRGEVKEAHFIASGSYEQNCDPAGSEPRP
jgi:gamma-glutamylcyclotransferase (GGCT)/AIG2-like uncharacterized protein YtfP